LAKEPHGNTNNKCNYHSKIGKSLKCFFLERHTLTYYKDPATIYRRSQIDTTAITQNV